jgi:hypothetical protein
MNRWAQTSGRPCQQLVLLTLLAVLTAGCGKKSVPITSSAPTPAAFDPARDGAPQPVPLPPDPQMQVIAADQGGDAVLGQLTAELRRYVRYTHNPPKSFEDFAAHDPFTCPPPPAGKKYVIAGGKVSLNSK